MIPIGTVIAGATGLTGQQILDRLLEDETFNPVIALLRAPLRRPNPRLQERVIDFEYLHLIPAPNLQTAFCALGTTIRKAGSQEAFRKVDHELVLRFARWAKAQGAGHFLVISSVGADPNSKNFYLRVKGEMEQELQSIGFQRLDIFRPSLLLGERGESRPTERLAEWLMKALPLHWFSGLARFQAVSVQDLATAMVARAKDPVDGTHVHEHAAIEQLMARKPVVGLG